MTHRAQPHPIVRPEERVLLVVGSYGSGKTEVAVNLALELAEGGRDVQLADLDLVNPYFRSREARALLEAAGIHVVMPSGAHAYADLPIVLPEIRGLFNPPPGRLSVFDVGGDDVGARALASFRCAVQEGSYELWQVVNARRPFTDSVEGCRKMRWELEAASRFQVTGLLVNSHLMDDTTPADILAGWTLAREISEADGLPIRCVAVMDALADAPELAVIDAPILRLTRRMLPPWLMRGSATSRDAADDTLPAARPVPIGKPPGEFNGSHPN